MNIIFISHYAGKGGANNELLQLAEELKKKGNTIYIVMPSGGYMWEQAHEKYNCKIVRYHRWVDSLSMNRVKRRVGGVVKWLINMRAAIQLYEYFKDMEIDVIHTNDSLTVVGAYLAKFLKKPHVWHVREFLEEDYNITHAYGKKYVNKWLSCAKYVVAISDAIMQKCKAQYNNINLVKVYDGVTIQEYSDSEKYTRFSILFTGGTSENKGVKDILALSLKLRAIDDEFDIIIAGSCQITEELTNFINQNELNDNIKFIGFVDNLSEIRQKCHVACMCSKKEAFGLVTVEAMLDKTLVVGKNAGATKEIVQNGMTGYLYNEDNIDEMINYVLKSKKASAENIVENAYQYAVKTFDIVNVAKKIEQLYL